MSRDGCRRKVGGPSQDRGSEQRERTGRGGSYGRGCNRTPPPRRREVDPDRPRFDALTKSREATSFKNPVKDSTFLLQYSIDMKDDDDLLSRLSSCCDKVTTALINTADFKLLIAFVQRLRAPLMSVGLRKHKTEDLLAACVGHHLLVEFLVKEVTPTSTHQESFKFLVWLVRTLATSDQYGNEMRSNLDPLAKKLIDCNVQGASELRAIFVHGIPLRSSNAFPELFDRHDNDHEDWRNVNVLPTVDEIRSDLHPFIPDAPDRCSEIQDDPPTDCVISEATRLHLEHHFRLAREDYVGPLRAATRDGTGRKYRNVEIENFDCDAHQARPGDRKHFSRGLIRITLEFPKLPRGLVGATRAVAKQFWDSPGARRILPKNALVAFRDEQRDEIVGFAVIVQRVTHDLLNTAQQDGKQGLRWRPRIGIDVTQFGDENAKILLGYMGMGPSQALGLIQTDTSLFAYTPFLRALQRLSKLPFAEELVMGSTTPQHPSYFNEDEEINDRICELEEMDGFSYDASQKDAIRRALTSRISLTQGPPGTGKTHLGSRLAKIIVNHSNARILCVTVTNHACDDFLHEVFKAGVPQEQIIRIGKEPKVDDNEKRWLKDRNLYTLGQGSGGRDAAECYHELEELTDLLREWEASLKDKEVWKRVPRMKFFADFFQVDGKELRTRLQWCEEAFKLPRGMTVKNNQVCDQDGFQLRDIRPWTLWDDWTKGKELRDELKDKSTHMLWQKTKSERMQLLNTWKKEIRNSLQTDALNTLSKLRRTNQLLQEVHNARLPDVLSSCSVIGCTTNAAAKHRDLLAAADVKVLIVEEAGEVLENHVLASLPTKAEHLIMIGDHMQLRPKIENNDLDYDNPRAEHKLNISLFERLIKEGLPHGLLLTQHRMHPDIAQLINGTYPDLRNGASTVDREPVRGLRQRLQFITHSADEDQAGTDSVSKSNKGEARLVVNAVKYLCQHGYGEANMIILTSYVAQLVLLTEMLNKANLGAEISEEDRNELTDEALDTIELAGNARRRKKGIRVAVVDNFQGEEADIVIVSLVRSNNDGSIGFLKNENRVNVLLTRARLGMIVIGNHTTFERKDNVWRKLIPKFGRVRTCLAGQCQTHETPFDAHIADDAFDPQNNGCGARCGKTFDACGHRCAQSCHSGVCSPCKEEVRGLCPEGIHQLRKSCSGKYPRCQEAVIIRCPADRHDLVRDCSKRGRPCAQCQSEDARRQAYETARAEELKKIEAEMRDRHEEYLKGMAEIARISAGAEIEAERAAAEQRLREVREHLEEANARSERRIADIKQEFLKRVSKDTAKAREKRRKDNDALTEMLRRMHLNLAKNAENEAQNDAQRKENTRQLEQIRARLGDEECCNCRDLCPVTDLFKCDGGHGLCGECFEGHVRTSCDTNDEMLFARFGKDDCKIRCFDRHTCKCAFSSDALSRNPINHKRYLEALLKYRESIVLRDAQANFQAELRRRERESMLERIVRYIQERILNLSCPRCRQVFDEYNGCAALTCSRPGCHAAFCAYCQADCGQDAHSHVRGCQESVEGGLFVRREIWEEHMKEVRKRRIEGYLLQPDVAEHRAGILDMLNVQLRELGINIPSKVD